MIYEEIFKEFERDEVRYLVVGGVATNIYGYVRMTVDLDIMVDLSEENLSKIVSIMERQGYSPRAPVKPQELLSKAKRDEWIEKKGAVVFTFIDPLKPFRQIDIFLMNPLSFEETYARKEEIIIRGITVAVISLHDLIGMKVTTGRPRDLEDVEHLKKIITMKKGQ